MPTNRLRSLLLSLDLRQAGRWVVYGIVVGVVSGLGAALFFWLLEGASHLFLGRLAGHDVASPAGDRLFAAESGLPFHPWIFFVLPIAGGLVAGLLVWAFAPEAGGHGTDAVIDAFHNKKGKIRGRIPLVKGLATIATLSTGGSAGKEGPIAQIGAGFGSWLADRLGCSVKTRRVLLLAGTAGGLGAIFRAPLGGAVTAIEVLYREDFEAEALVPSIISSVAAYATFTSIFGYHPVFSLPGPLRFRNPLELGIYGVLALLCVPLGILYIKTFYGLKERVFDRLPVPAYVRPALGGLGVALLGLAVPAIYGGGFGQLEQAMNGQLAIGTMALLLILKILATSLTIGSGGSGGVFGPTLFIGGMLGGVVGYSAAEIFPGLIDQPAAFVLVGMGAFFAGVANASIGALLMVCEMTGGYGLVVPLMLVCVLALLFSRGFSIYRNQVRDKFHSPAHLGDFTVDVLAELRVGQAFQATRLQCVHPADTISELRRLVATSDDPIFPVLDDEGTLVGVVPVPKLRPLLFSDALQPLLLVEDIASPPSSVTPSDTLQDALSELHQTGASAIVVVDGERGNQVLGVLEQGNLLEAYHTELARRLAEKEADEEIAKERDRVRRG